jgi:hypothetical protein
MRDSSTAALCVLETVAIGIRVANLIAKILQTAAIDRLVKF